ncbi:MAG: LytTR family transcriptional regulator [Ruminococcaceae bacterium]|nr:LytTR family transcriptional regulator [Oscillospiraceae bacterium]
MGFRIRIDIDPECDEEVVIKCKSITDEVLALQAKLASNQGSEIELKLNDSIYFVRLSDILFFETDSGKTAAHTADRMYYSDLKLYELEETLPQSFLRISKSSIINIAPISSIRKDITGICEVFFRNTNKKVYVSRSYSKVFREKINETRLNQ